MTGPRRPFDPDYPHFNKKKMVFFLVTAVILLLVVLLWLMVEVYLG